MNNVKESFEDKILECLISNNYGLTVVAIAKKINASRNTIYRYLGILEGKNLIFRKEIGRYNLYFSREGRQVSRDIVGAFYKGLLIAFSKKIPEPSQFKEIGKTISKYVQLPFETEDIGNILKSELIKEGFTEILGVMRPYFSLLHDKIILKDIIFNEEKKNIVIFFINSDMLEEYEAGIYHFYLLTGYVEEKLKNRFNINAKCEVMDYQVSGKDQDNFIKISLELL